jgi:pyruvate/2-oxoglutarate dehydrogenase complex dihydrolipoamide acyltransferase (E2) component
LEEQRKRFSLSSLSRSRWNVLDMINVIGKGAVDTYLFCDVDATWAESLRSKYAQRGKKITLTAIMLKAIGIAQKMHPASRTAILPWGRTAILHDIVAGFTVERFVGSQPAVFFGAIDAPDSKPLEDIAQELRAYGEAEFENVDQLDVQHKFNNMPWLFRRFILWLGMRYPAIRLQHMGATFGLSSLGKFGIKALIPPCVSTSTFGIGELEQRPVVRDGKIEIRPVFTLTLNFDHRAIDGAPAARFLKDIISLVEGGLEQHLPSEDSTATELTPSFS